LSKKFFKRLKIIFVLLLAGALNADAQVDINGRVVDGLLGDPVAGATISFRDSVLTVTDNNGKFRVRLWGDGVMKVTAVGYNPIEISGFKPGMLIHLVSSEKELETVVVTGTLKPVTKLESPVPVEVYSPQFLKKNPAPSIFESLQQVNGVRPQLNCSVCNTGDIHMNGLEGPYTMITIDGMPIVSSLASVYGLFGIPTQMIDRVEIVRGPASGLYGSEAIGGLINIITRTPAKSPAFSANFMTNTWKEHNLDLGARYRLGNKISGLVGLNYFRYNDPRDHNHDQFTDVTLQHRVSLFNKISFTRRFQRQASIAGRLFYEDRWGGDLRWNESFRGTDSIYGENIETKRWELIGQYQMPFHERLNFSFSATGHQQDSWYGQVTYKGEQRIAFGQLTWDKQVAGDHSVLSGLAGRYNYYDDNSTATIDTLTGKNSPEKYFIPGLFVQDEWKLNSKHTVLTGARIDHHPVHRFIFTPRFAWKWSPDQKQVFRLNAGTGFRVVNLFTEDHAALTGSRSVEVEEALHPERSYNVNLNYSRHWKKNTNSFSLDASAWYSYFNNQIIPDYSDPRKIIYANLDGYARSMGLTLNTDWNLGHRFKTITGITVQDVSRFEANSAGKREKIDLVLVEKWSGTWLLTYIIPASGLSFDYTGNIYGPMTLPLISELDPRPRQSPVWSIQNLQATKKFGTRWELYGGVKNLLNWTPSKGIPFMIARTHDPFNKKVEYEPDGTVRATPENPYALTFDPGYVYAPNQGRKVFFGLRLVIR
jgi:outer membrane receptor for ferrienterochelin and colicins